MLKHSWIYLVFCTTWAVIAALTNSKPTDQSLRIEPRLDSEFRKNFEDEIDDSNEISEELNPKIINGRPAKDGEFPWMVALHYNARFVCSSFLISPTIVMTAAHCVKFENGVAPASAFYGIVGNNLREGPDTRIEFSEVAAHPDYGTGEEYDIAVLRTSSPVQMGEKIQSICLPDSNQQLNIEQIQAMGWGATSNAAREAPKELMTTELSIPSMRSCRRFYALSGITITERHLCVNSNRRTGVCFGDSGSPAVFEDSASGKPVAVGVASFISFLRCGPPLIPSVYTRTSSYIDWLRETVKDTNGICFVQGNSTFV
ncbi:serine protease 33 [Trichonephila clavata]|uniref:Serine protease 33 n=1 Tax=Trichonephila clavata TaxID=2740835 RepID=A0A8X6I0T8_TRICU|nr:serine protease 33 [Trichonephila clavata]